MLKEQAYSIKGKVDMACSLKKTTRGIECTKGTSQNHNNGNKLVPLRGIKYVNKILKEQAKIEQACSFKRIIKQ